MYILSPSIFAADCMNFGTQLNVPNFSFGPDFVRILRENTDMVLDVHLMINDPLRYVDDFAAAGADIITVHMESCDNIREVIDKIHNRDKEAGIVLKPETQLNTVTEELWDSIQVLQVITVQPGLRGQHFISQSLSKIRMARDYINANRKRIDIEVDGDITLTHLQEVLEAGANIVVVGKALFQGMLSRNIRKYQEADSDCFMYQFG